MARLPGGLAVWRGRRLLGPRPPQAAAQDPARAGPVVDAGHHPALHSLVLDAAKYADVPPPAAVRLGGAASVHLADGGLVVGLPLVWGLSAEQLRVVLTHELALPASRHPDLVRGLLNARLRVPRSEKAEARHARLLEATDALLDEAERARDAAAVTAAGGGLSAVEDAALAVYRAAAIREAFSAFAAAPVPVPPDPGDTGDTGHTAARPADLHAGWRLRLERWGAPAHDAAALAAALPSLHPGLATELRTIAPGPHAALADGSAAVGLDPLDAGQERALAAEVLPGDGPWTRFAELPVESYLGDVERQAREYVEAVHEVLGRPPDDRDELAGTLLRRPVDVERARRGLPGGEDGEDADAPSWVGATLLAVVVEYTLLKRGWRREHPLLPRRLTGPDGGVLDLNELVRSPEELRRHLG